MRCLPWRKRSNAARSRPWWRSSTTRPISPRHGGSHWRHARAAASACCCATRRTARRAPQRRAGASRQARASRMSSGAWARPHSHSRSLAIAAVRAATGHLPGTTMNTPSRRYLSVWLRRLATDRIANRSGAPDEPLVTTAPVKSALRLAAVNDAAAALGLTVGMPLADARAMYPKINVADADAAADLALLEAIADWCDRYTPLVGLDAPDGLTLDITGCAHLFGGEATLAADLVRRLTARGLQARAAVAGTVGCAWAMARYGDAMIVASGDERAALSPLPLAALRL